MISELSYNILKKMPKNNPTNIFELGLDQNEDSVRRSIEELKNLDLIVLSENKIMDKISISNIGKNYLNNEFEVEILSKYVPIKINELNQKLENAGLIISVTKRLNLIKIENGILDLVDKDLNVWKKYRFILNNIDDNHDKKLIEEMINLGYITNTKKSENYFIINEKGLSVANQDLIFEKEITNYTSDIIKEKKWDTINFKKYNVEVDAPNTNIGKMQPYKKFLDSIKVKLTNMGFEEMDSSLTTTEFYNFDVLFQPQNHTARTWTDTYSIKKPNLGDLEDKDLIKKIKDAHETGGVSDSIGWKYKWDENIARKIMPAAHATAFSAKKMTQGVKVPQRYFSISRVYRPDVLDATHLNEFNQMEGFIVAKDLSFKHLLGMLASFAYEIAGAEDIMFYPDYYPFTEPSVQLSAKHPKLGWVEFGGAGIFRPEITENLGIKERVIAWGLGIDRLAMFNLGIDDIRDLFTYKLDWLRDKPLIDRV